MGRHDSTLESHQPLCPSQITDLRLAASKMTGPTRRAFQAEVNHCPLKEAAFDNKFCSPIEGSQSLLDWASLGC